MVSVWNFALRAAVVCSAVCVMVVGVGGLASAEASGVNQPAPSPPTAPAMSKVPLVPAGVSDASRVGVGSFSGCYGESFAPFPIDGWAEGQAITYCAPAVATAVNSTMSRGRWYGLQTLASDSGNGTDEAVAWPMWQCTGGTYTYYLSSFHTALVDGDSAYGATSSLARFACG